MTLAIQGSTEGQGHCSIEHFQPWKKPCQGVSQNVLRGKRRGKKKRHEMEKSGLKDL
jgi:hypothetical protein